MLKLKQIQTKQVIYQGLEVSVPMDTQYMWLHSTDVKTVLYASPNKPLWSEERQRYVASFGTSKVAELEYAKLTTQQVKDSLETEDDLVSEEDKEKLKVVENLIKNLRNFASSLERNVNKTKEQMTTEKIESLMQHVYADDGELDTFYNCAVAEAITNNAVELENESEEDTDLNSDEQDYDALVKLLATILK